MALFQSILSDCFFRSQYGDSKLEYPLFGNEGVGRFDKIDLRTSQNYAWAQGDSRNTMLREVFSRDSQRDMGQPYTRSRFYHLYLNGMYWGLYQTQERSEARYASDYFGGSPDDYDVVKVNTEDWNYQIEATDGNLDLWREIYKLTQGGFADMKNYYRLEGRDKNGLPDKKSYKLVDIDNLIDYMLSIFYTGNFDAPTSSFGGNDGANNFYAINQRNNPTTGFIFFNHDAEHSLFAQAASPGIGLYEDRVNIGTRSGNLRMSVSWFGAFHPQWLHFRLSENSEYRSRFCDRVYKHFRSGGAFSVDSSLARYDKRRTEIDQAIIAESARWGDGGENVSLSYDRDRHWINAANKTRHDFLPYRRNIVLDQLRAARLYSELMPPILKVSGEQVIKESIHFSDAFELEIQNVNSRGEIYYTLDGSDPRLVGGSINKNAIASSGSLLLSISKSTIVKSRIFEGGEWSAMNVTNCLNNSEDYSMLKITEIHYNPMDSIHGTDTISGSNYEFLEFKNTGDYSINLGGLKLDSAVNYVFPSDMALAPGAFFVIASDYIDFFERYGKYASGIFNKNLSNSGEVITMYDRYENEILRFSYDDESPWPLNADGLGYSLVARQGNPESIPSMYDYWISSHDIGGSPFLNDQNSELVFQKEEFYRKLNIYPNPATEFIMVEGDSNQNDEIEMQIYSLSGVRLLVSKVYPGDRIDFDKSVFKSGIYLVEMHSGQHISLSKLVIAR